MPFPMGPNSFSIASPGTICMNFIIACPKIIGENWVTHLSPTTGWHWRYGGREGTVWRCQVGVWRKGPNIEFASLFLFYDQFTNTDGTPDKKKFDGDRIVTHGKKMDDFGALRGMSGRCLIKKNGLSHESILNDSIFNWNNVASSIYYLILLYWSLRQHKMGPHLQFRNFNLRHRGHI